MGCSRFTYSRGFIDLIYKNFFRGGSMELIVNVIIYTFAFLGLIILIDNLTEYFCCGDESSRLILLVSRNERNLECILRHLLRVVRKRRVVSRVYVLFENEDRDTLKMLEIFTKNNDFITKIDRNEMINLISDIQSNLHRV